MQVVAVHGDRQEGKVGEPLNDSLVVRVVDTTGVGISGREVTWAVTIGGGTLVPERDTSDADGLASAKWTLGPEPGANAARATISGISFVTFTAVSTGGGDGGGNGGDSTPSASRSSLSADPASIVAGAGSSTITVTVRNDRGDPIEGATVSLEASGTGVTVTQPDGATESDGTATGTVAGAAPGTIVVSATVNGSIRLAQTADVTVTEVPETQVDHFVFRLQPHDVRKNERFRVEVAMADADGNLVPLAGILLYLGLFPVGSDSPTNTRLLGNRFRETEDGVAVFDDLAVDKKGHYRLRVLSDQLPELGPHGPEPYLFSLPFEVK
jgi:Invasin, domain 3